MIIIVRPKTQLQFAAQTDSDYLLKHLKGVYFVYCNCDQQRADHCPNQSAGPLRIKISDRIEFIQIEPGRFKLQATQSVTALKGSRSQP